MAYEGDAAEQVIRIALSGGDIALRLTGSFVKNAAAFLLAMRQKNKVVYGRKSLKKLMRNTRDLRIFDMTPAQFKAFQKQARPKKILYAGVGDKRRKGGTIDLFLPLSEIERANTIFAAVGYTPTEGRQAVQPEQGLEQEQDAGKKKDTRSRLDSKDSRDRSTTQSSNSKKRKPEKPSVTAKLEAFDKIAKQKDAKPKARAKGKRR